MRTLKKNRQDVWFAVHLSKTPVRDANGHRSGENSQTYGEPQKASMSWADASGAIGLGSSGMATLELYGIVTNYTAKAITEDMNCEMDKDSKVWHGIEPTKTVTVTRTENGETITEEQEVPVPHNYVVVRKVPSLNLIAYYLREVNAS